MYKFNNGNGAIVCNNCRIIIREPAVCPQREHYNDFDLCPECRPEWLEKIWMEDINRISLAALATIEQGFSDRGADINDKKYESIWEDIYKTIWTKLQDYSTGEYKHHL